MNSLKFVRNPEGSGKEYAQERGSPPYEGRLRSSVEQFAADEGRVYQRPSLQQRPVTSFDENVQNGQTQAVQSAALPPSYGHGGRSAGRSSFGPDNASGEGRRSNSSDPDSSRQAPAGYNPLRGRQSQRDSPVRSRGVENPQR